MRYVSLFSGIEAASVAWHELGFRPVAFSEIDPFPCAVLKHHYPDVPDLGDITKIDWSDCELGAIDLVVGGSPCQSFSIAGNRTGLKGASGLMFEYIRAVRCLRPSWFVWENVPGALSSEGGDAFLQLLIEMDELGYGLAWRVLDAQFFGVPQRRRRVFLVGSLGSKRSGEVLFERESLSWDSESSAEKRKALTGRPQRGVGAFLPNNGDKAGSIAVATELSPTLKTEHNPAMYKCTAKAISWNRHDGRCEYPKDPSLVQTLSAHMGTGGDNVPPILETTRNIYEIAGNIIGRQDGNGGHQLGVRNPDLDGSFTLTATDRHAVWCAPDIPHSTASLDVAPTLTCHEAKSASYVIRAQTLKIRSGKAGGGKGALIQDELTATLATHRDQTLFERDSAPRRLTPMECERLQGFPDGYTDIPYRGKEHAPDSARYKALGNSMAVPVMAWIGKRIKENT